MLATVISIVAGASTRWFSDVPQLVLGLIAVAALVVVLKASGTMLGAIVLASPAAAVAARLPTLRLEESLQGLVFGLLVVLALAGPLTVRRAVEQQQAFQRRGWEMAALLARRRASEIREAQQRERMSLAAEMHDGLGHALTLIAVQLGHLSLNPSLAPADRRHVAGIRQTAADAAEELGLAVQLLRTSDDAVAGWASTTVEDAINGARKAGMDVTADVPAGFETELSVEVRTAVVRVVQEGLTNAAKHAPGKPARVHIEAAEGQVRVLVSNDLNGTSSESGRHSNGVGLLGLRHRAQMLGGDLGTHQSRTRFTLTLTLPRHARPILPNEDGVEEIRDAETVSANARSRAARTAAVLPAAIVGAGVFVVAAYFVLVTMLSVMTPQQFHGIEVGDDRTITEQVLPPFEMLDPPRNRFPEQPGEDCHYYEQGISFFERLDVYVVCFTDDSVSHTETVPAP